MQSTFQRPADKEKEKEKEKERTVAAWAARPYKETAWLLFFLKNKLCTIVIIIPYWLKSRGPCGSFPPPFYSRKFHARKPRNFLRTKNTFLSNCVYDSDLDIIFQKIY
jgi:hypothetical protein